MKNVVLDKHQIEGADVIFNIFKENALVYVEWEERTRKTMAVMEALRKTTLKDVLWITKKKPLVPLGKEWQAYSSSHSPDYQLTAINYESLHKLTHKNYDCVVLDEAHHAIASYPKPSSTWKKTKVFCKNKPLIYISATPYPETLSQIYHQLALSDWSPFFEYSSFYKWHLAYGIPYTQHIGVRQIKKYDKVNDEDILKHIKHLFTRKTRLEIGFKQEPKDKVHLIELSPSTLKRYTDLDKHSVATINDVEVVAETVVAVLQKKAQLVGGTMKIEDIEKATENKMAYKTFWTGNTEKIDYIKNNWGDTEEMVVMYHYKEEEHLLKHHFKKAKILQADTWAEGISLKKYKHLIIYSMSWRTSKYIQRRARQADMSREDAIIVHYILTQFVDNHIYKAVAEKKVNFNSRYFFNGM